MHTDVPRRVLLLTLGSALLPAWRSPAQAFQRITAQSVGVDQDVGLLGDPRTILDRDGVKPLIWGARDRCDPTDPSCTAGGKTIEVGRQAVPVTPLKTNVKVRFDVSIAGEAAGSLTLGLDPSAGPGSVDAFVQLCRGMLVSSPGDDPASYVGSRLVQVQRDKAIVMGELTRQGGSLRIVPGVTRPQRFFVTPPTNSDPPNSLSHNQAGLVSVRRGGGSFQFVITPRPNPSLDRDQLIIGQLLDEESMALLERFNSLAINNYDSSPLAKVQVVRVAVS